MTKRTIQTLMCRAMPVLLCCIACALVVSWFVANALIAPVPRNVGDPPPGLNGVSISIASDSGSTIAGWHLRNKSESGVIVLLHGIRSSRLSMLNRAKELYQSGYSIVMIDLQAHGESPGEAITVGHLEKHDVRAAIEYARIEHPQERIGVIGVSLGGAAALLASPLKIDALVLESVYSDVDHAIHNRVKAKLGALSYIPAELLLIQLGPRLGVARNELCPIKHLPDVGCPVFIASGTIDEHTTIEETQRMFEAATEPKELWLVSEAAHVDLYDFAKSEYRTRVFQFLDRNLGK